MIPRSCKRLAEVDFPIAEVSRHAVRQNTTLGHPSKLHLWWARRPLASCRGLLIALLLPDPCDDHCPSGFKKQARQILQEIRRRPANDMELRKALLWFIGVFSSWEMAGHPIYLRVARALVSAAHGPASPLVVDPFAGGGSIPFEALRLGCDTFASDLNPVACLILKALLDDIPRGGGPLIDEFRRVANDTRRQAEQDLAELFPADPDGATPFAFLWARTVRCEAPACGAEIPLMRSFWLCQKPKRRRALRHRIIRAAGSQPRLAFELFKPISASEVGGATVSGAKATCLCCGSVLSRERVRHQIAIQRGGTDVVFDEEGCRIGGARMMAVATVPPGAKRRYYRSPCEADYEAVRRSQDRLADILQKWERLGRKGACPVPDERLPPVGTLGFRVQRYGILEWQDLFTARQKMAIILLLSRLANSAVMETQALQRLVALSLGKLLRHCNVLSKWHRKSETVAGAFGMQTLPMSWDFPEMYPDVSYAGGLKNCFKDVADCIEKSVRDLTHVGQTELADSIQHPLPDETSDVWFTDPPYYDAIPYSDLSDFFLVWLKRALPDHAVLRDPFDPDNPLSPKRSEIVQDKTKQVQGRPKDREWFEEMMSKTFAEGCRVLNSEGIGCVVFAHKTTEGWEALLAGMIRGGWTITASWPIATERSARLRARDSAALATSVHLVCRPRANEAPIGDWSEVLQELPGRVADWIERLQAEGIRGADLVFACIGPALEIFSRYRAVETPAGRRVKLPEYLEKIWEVVGRTALQRVLGTARSTDFGGQIGALEEDSRLTALFLWTLQSTEQPEEKNKARRDEEAIAKAVAKGLSLPFDVVRRFAQPMGINLDRWTNRIIEQKKGIVRLLPVAKRAKELFGEEGASVAAGKLEKDADLQATLFPDWEPTGAPRAVRGRKGKILGSDAELREPDATTLDRVHAAMLLQRSGHTNALRRLISEEQDRGPEFLRLANALSALYPRGSQEKRLLDAMLLAVPR